MGRKQEERGGACCCCAVREGMLCERSCRGEGEKTLSEADCAGKMFAAAGNLPRLRPAGGGRFFPAGGGTRWKTACRGGAQKRDTFRSGASGTCCFEKCGEAGSLPVGGRDGCCLLACGGLAIRRVTPNASFRPGAKDASSISKGRFVGPPASAPTRRLRPAPSRRMQGAKKGRRNADGLKMTL